MIRFHRVHKTYPPRQIALRGVSTVIDKGEFVFVAGASGAGKSTLLRLGYGAERATQGEVVVAGRTINQLAREGVASLRREVGIIFQDYKLLASRSVLENVAFPLEVRGIGREERSERALLILKTVGLGDKAHVPPMTLSGGEQQRVAVARALVHRPRIIFADEPTGNLDRDMANLVFDLLLEANQAGVTVVVATHSLSIIDTLNKRTLVLDRGQIIGDYLDPRRGVTRESRATSGMGEPQEVGTEAVV
jgi:cell division transport system ATP-binding protein